MIALVTAMVLTAPATGLVVSEQIGKPTHPLAAFFEPIEAELLAAKLGVIRLSAKCDGKRTCVVEAGRAAGVPTVVAVTIAWGKRQTIDLEVIRVRDAVTLNQLTFTTTGKLTDSDRARVRVVAVQLFETLTAEDNKVSDVPRREPELVTSVPSTPDAGLVVAAPAPSRSKVPGWMLVGGGAAAGVTAGVLAGVASSQRALVETDPSPLTRAEAQNLANQANGEYTAALVCTLAASALVTAGIVWLVAE